MCLFSPSAFATKAKTPTIRTVPYLQNAEFDDSGVPQDEPGSVPYGVAPPNMPWAEGLPLPKQNKNGSICLPPALADEVFAHLMYLDIYPQLCQEAIDYTLNVVDQAMKKHVDHLAMVHFFQKEKAVQKAHDEAVGTKTLEIVLWTAGGLTVGAGLTLLSLTLAGKL